MARPSHTCRRTAAGIARLEAHGFDVGVTAPAGFVPAAAGRSVASCRVGEGAEARLACGVRPGVGVVSAGTTASGTVTA